MTTCSKIVAETQLKQGLFLTLTTKPFYQITKLVLNGIHSLFNEYEWSKKAAVTNNKIVTWNNDFISLSGLFYSVNCERIPKGYFRTGKKSTYLKVKAEYKAFFFKI